MIKIMITVVSLLIVYYATMFTSIRFSYVETKKDLLLNLIPFYMVFVIIVERLKELK